jgi:hypothetical protein
LKNIQLSTWSSMRSKRVWWSMKIRGPMKVPMFATLWEESNWQIEYSTSFNSCQLLQTEWRWEDATTPYECRVVHHEYRWYWGLWDLLAWYPKWVMCSSVNARHEATSQVCRTVIVLTMPESLSMIFRISTGMIPMMPMMAPDHAWSLPYKW